MIYLNLGKAVVAIVWAIFWCLIGWWASKLFHWMTRERKPKDDGYDKARLKAAEECMKQGKPITGRMYPDGRIEIDK